MTALDARADALADRIAELAADKKAVDVVVLDLRGVIGYTDFFVICSGNTERQTKAIHDAIHQGMKHEHGLLPRRVEGLSESRWILMDYLDVDRPRLHARRARLLPARAAVGRGPAARGRRALTTEAALSGGLVAMELRGLEPLTFWLPARRSPS